MKQLKVLTISKPSLKKNVKHIQVENKLETIKSVLYVNSTEHFLQLLIALQINVYLMFISNTSHVHVSESALHCTICLYRVWKRSPTRKKTRKKRLILKPQFLHVHEYMIVLISQ